MYIYIHIYKGGVVGGQRREIKHALYHALECVVCDVTHPCTCENNPFCLKTHKYEYISVYTYTHVQNRIQTRRHRDVGGKT